ncbi:MAG TPA: hypothetical protein P5121_20030 [Caldilineaceae bacterium]|nr:hypothetical protein [Caldilineaceae bacterium]
MATSERYPSYATCVAKVLSGSAQPLTVDTLLSRIKEHRPITKGARSAVYRAIGQLFQAVPVAPSRYGWLSSLLGKNTFRHVLTGEEVRRGFLMLDELEHAVFFPQFFQTYQPDDRKLQIELFGGPTIEAEAYIERKTWSLRLGSTFIEWIDELGGQGRDDLLIFVDDALAGRYQLRLQPREMRDPNVIQGRNIQLALLAEELVSEDRRARTAMPTAELAARIIGRGFFADALPPDDFHFVLHQYSLLRFHNGVGYSFDLENMDFAADVVPSGSDDSGDGFGEAVVRPDLDREALNAAEMMYSDFLQDDMIGQGDDEWEDLLFEPEAADMPFFDSSDDLFDNSCASYEAYVEAYQESDSMDGMLSHSDFHLLEAELETLVALEQEFGYLLADQMTRKEQLIERLFIDPETLLDNDFPDYPDFDEPPFWEN